MSTSQIIDRRAAIDLLDGYPENPLFAGLSRADGLDLLVGSLYLYNDETRAMHVDEWNPAIFGFLEHYLAETDPDDVAIPLLLIKGTVEYYFETGESATPPLIGYMQAPFINFYVPFAFGTRIILPGAGSSPGSMGVIVDPLHFKEVAGRNLWIYDIVMKDRHRLIAMFLKLSSIHRTFSHDNRLARFLFASLPAQCHEVETLKMTQSEIARTLGLSRATLAKAIASLYEAGIIETGRGKIHIRTAPLTHYIKTHS